MISTSVPNWRAKLPKFAEKIDSLTCLCPIRNLRLEVTLRLVLRPWSTRIPKVARFSYCKIQNMSVEHTIFQGGVVLIPFSVVKHAHFRCFEIET